MTSPWKLLGRNNSMPKSRRSHNQCSPLAGGSLRATDATGAIMPLRSEARRDGPFAFHLSTEMKRPLIKRLHMLLRELEELQDCEDSAHDNDSADHLFPFQLTARRIVAAAERLHHRDIDSIVSRIRRSMGTEGDLNEFRTEIRVLTDAIEDLAEQVEIAAERSHTLSSPHRASADVASSDKTPADEVSANEATKVLDIRIYDTLLMIICAAATDSGYRGPENRNNAVSLIRDKLARLGHHLSEKTIRKYLDIAAELFDPEALKNFR